MAGMGVQSPNCCVDGWDLGWRADAYILGDGSIFVSAYTWGTCYGNANCGGHFWQNPRYHSQTEISLPDPSTPIRLRMMWESGDGQLVLQLYRSPLAKVREFQARFSRRSLF